MKLVGPFTQIVTLDSLPIKGRLADDQLEIIAQGGIVFEDGKILDVGTFESLDKAYPKIDKEMLKEDLVAFPGIIDAHTHICFGGTRSMDFAARNDGKTYLEIAEAGGGIWSTVTNTRTANVAELTEGILGRLDYLESLGITTVEVKSGYGLDEENELKMLEAIRDANLEHTSDLISTCLAAHMKPKDFEGDEKAYLEHVLKVIVPQIQERNLTDRFDIFIEKSAFDPKLSLWYLKKLKRMGFAITVHGDQFTTGGSKVAVDVGANSVDHLEVSGDKEIDLIAKSDTVAVALPGASIGLGVDFTPARKLLDKGACVAIASDWNPGSAPQGNLIAQAAILSTYEKLSAAEVWAGITFRAAKALGLQDRGIIKKGLKGDVIAYPTASFSEVLYQMGRLTPKRVWKDGEARF